MISPLLPPVRELQSLIRCLSGFEVEVVESNGQISISGSWEAISTVEATLCDLISEKKEEDPVGITVPEPILSEEVEETRNETTAAQSVRDSMLDENVRECVDSGNEECLNIEVFHSDLRDESVKTNYKFACTLCSFKSQRESHFLKHSTLHQTMTTVYRCDECSFSTLRFAHLRKHQVIHSVKALTCSSCDYSTDDVKLLARHNRMKHKVTVPVVSEEGSQIIRQCPACSYTTTRLYLYQRHMKVHSAEESKGGPNLFICSQCDYRTSRKMHYVRHVRDVHRQWRPHLCHHCGKAFKRPDALKQHSLLHATTTTDSKLVTFQCRVCSKVCHSRAHLKEHEAVHSSERSFLCEICGASFKTRSVQRKHVATLHQNPRAHPCRLCNKRFNTNYALRRHMKQHPLASSEVEEEAEDRDDLSNEVVSIVLPGDQLGVSEGALTLTVQLDGTVEEEEEAALLYLPEREHQP